MFAVIATFLERRTLGLLTLLGIAGSLLVSHAGGHHAPLPGVALGSTALLYVEKATACFVSYLLVLVVVVRAFAGELPSELRGLKYAVAKDSHDFTRWVERLTVAEEELHERIDHIERVVATNAPQ
jgi:hypothetical protein